MILRNPSRWRDSFFVACLFFLVSFSQPLSSQGVIGFVRDGGTKAPIGGAMVSVMKADSVIATLSTDPDGSYQYVSSDAGRIRLLVTVLGYVQQISADIFLDGYSTYRIEFMVEINSYDLDVVTITSTRLFNPTIQKVTAEDLSVTAANFDDPVRVATSKPGIVQLNDQANRISVRGQNPIFNSWYLEGLEIANPNHTNNAGTFSDVPTQSGGGVNMFSAQALGSTDIYTGLNPLSIGRSTGAVIDMHLHESPKPEQRAKAGLLGLEVGNGFALGANSMLDLNARYSFTGLLANLGVDFGGEKIGFSDVVASYHHRGTKHRLKLYTWGGRSYNDFDRVKRPELNEEYKDFFNIYFESFIGGLGLRYDYTFSPKLSLRSGGSFSESNSEYHRQGQFGPLPVDIDLHDDVSILSSMVELIITHSPFVQSTAGINYTSRFLNSFGLMKEENFLRPYVSAKIELSPEFNMEAGGEVYYSFITEKTIPGYRAIVQWVSGNHQIYGGLRHAAGQAFVDPSELTSSALLIIDKYELGWTRITLRNTLGLKFYFQGINKMTRYTTQNGIAQLADYGDLVAGTYFTLNNNGIGHYYGAEGEWNYRSNNGWRLSANQTIYKSVRGTIEEALQPGRYDGRFATHIIIAKEVVHEKKGKNRIWNFSMRGFLHGGIWEPTIDEGLSDVFESTIFEDPDIFNQQLPHYKRIDVSISRTIANQKVRWRYALDIQNVAGFTNIAYHYYDPFLQSIESQEQLGIIPVLSIQASW